MVHFTPIPKYTLQPQSPGCLVRGFYVNFCRILSHLHPRAVLYQLFSLPFELFKWQGMQLMAVVHTLAVTRLKL